MQTTGARASRAARLLPWPNPRLRSSAMTVSPVMPSRIADNESSVLALSTTINSNGCAVCARSDVAASTAKCTAAVHHHQHRDGRRVCLGDHDRHAQNYRQRTCRLQVPCRVCDRWRMFRSKPSSPTSWRTRRRSAPSAGPGCQRFHRRRPHGPRSILRRIVSLLRRRRLAERPFRAQGDQT